MKPLSLLKSAGILLLLWVLIFSPPSVGAAGEDTGKSPNVLFIAVDDLNDFPAFMGRYPDAKTPNLDRLAERGMAFFNAHAQYPICGPSRASIMSGMHPSTLGWRGHMADQDLGKRAWKLGGKLMHRWFADNGYRTMAVGKICHHHVPEGSVDASGGRGSFTGGTGKLRRNWDKKGTVTDWAPAPEKDEELPDHEAASWAVRQLQADHDRPFLLMVGFLRPHVPWYVPRKWFDLYDRDRLTLPPWREDDLEDVPPISKKLNILPQMPRTEWAKKNDQWRDIVHAYLASISFADHCVGRVLEALDNSRYREDTIVVLWSDHGYHMGEKNTFQKHSLWQRSSHVPLIFAGPGIGAGTRCERTVGLIDIYPTLTDLCGLPANEKNEGRSLAPLLKDPGTPWPHAAVTSWLGDHYAVQTETHRYILYEDGSEELYDHRTDPEEWNNLASEARFDELKKKMASEIPSIRFADTGNVQKKR